MVENYQFYFKFLLDSKITTTMFIGEYNHNLDEKGRLAIPAKFRAILKKGAVVTKGLDGCLFLYSKNQFEEIAKKFAALPLSQSKARAFARHMLAGAMDVEFDNQGRSNFTRIFAYICCFKEKSNCRWFV
jgi:division/cell wall cluster transcriptional repressor MraZ